MPGLWAGAGCGQEGQGPHAKQAAGPRRHRQRPDWGTIRAQPWRRRGRGATGGSGAGLGPKEEWTLEGGSARGEELHRPPLGGPAPLPPAHPLPRGPCGRSPRFWEPQGCGRRPLPPRPETGRNSGRGGYCLAVVSPGCARQMQEAERPGPHRQCSLWGALSGRGDGSPVQMGTRPHQGPLVLGVSPG